MRRPIKVLLVSGATIAVAALLAACGTERVSVSHSDPTYHGAVLFSQRCSGCHTLSYAATHGSAGNVRTRENINGPNFDVRCERPIARVIYAIENGGFSGAYMPQNVVVGKDAIDVAQFLSKYGGRQAPKAPGVTSCQSQAIGTLPAPAPPPVVKAATPKAATPAAPTTPRAAAAPRASKAKPKPAPAARKRPSGKSRPSKPTH